MILRARGPGQDTGALPGFAVLLVSAAAYVLLSGTTLPPLVASHFGAAGAADGFTPRNDYLVFMLTVTVVLPALVGVSHLLLRLVPVRLINLPNREYWLAPERLESTLGYLRMHTMRFAVMLILFMCFVHWSVLEANALQPPRLSEGTFIAGILVFGVAIALWARAWFVRFRRGR